MTVYGLIFITTSAISRDLRFISLVTQMNLKNPKYTSTRTTAGTKSLMLLSN